MTTWQRNIAVRSGAGSSKEGLIRHQCGIIQMLNLVSGAKTWEYLSRGWSTEYHICYYTPKCSSWPVVFKSSICYLGKHGITPVFKMASKTAPSYRNYPWNNSCISESNSIHKILFLNILINVTMLINYIYRYKYAIITI